VNGAVRSDPLQVRALGRVSYREAEVLQRALHGAGGPDGSADPDGSDSRDYLLLLEHPHVYTMGSAAKPEHVLVDPASVGADLLTADRGGDVTYHGPGQLVGYPIVTLDDWRAGQRDVVAYVRSLESVLIAVLGDFGIVAGREPRYPGVWVGDEKIAAIGVRVARGRTRHGFALNVDPDLAMFDHIVPCGIADRGVTSMAAVLGACRRGVAACAIRSVGVQPRRGDVAGAVARPARRGRHARERLWPAAGVDEGARPARR